MDVEFELHGLHHVELDPDLSPSSSRACAPSAFSADRETRITGRALLKPVTEYPLNDWAHMQGDLEPRRVRFKSVYQSRKSTDFVPFKPRSPCLSSPLTCWLASDRLAPASNPAGLSPNSDIVPKRRWVAEPEYMTSSLSLLFPLPPLFPALLAALEHFRRNHELLTALYSQIDSSNPYTPDSHSNPTTPRAERPYSPSTSTSLLPFRSTNLAPPTTRQWPRAEYKPYVDRIIAWWEDSYGAWMIIEDAEEGNFVSLEQYWHSIMQGSTRDGMEDFLISEKDQLKEEIRIYGGEAIQLLIQVAEILLVSVLSPSRTP